MTIAFDGHFSDVVMAVTGGLITLLIAAIWRSTSGWFYMQLRRAQGWAVAIFTPKLKAVRNPRRIAIASSDGKSLIVRDQAYEELVRQLEKANAKLRKQDGELSRFRAQEALRKPITLWGVKADDVVMGATIGSALESMKVGSTLGQMGARIATAIQKHGTPAP